MECASGKKNGSSETHLQKRQRTDDNARDGSSKTHLQKRQRREDNAHSARVNFDVLDCPVCYEPLTIPIFQCDNGHVACSSCGPKLSNKCPVYGLHIGNNRCRAMEGVLESALVSCRNAKLGCTKTVSYGRESTHAKECTFSLCSCPGLDCSYAGSYKDLYYHFNLTHRSTHFPILFRCGTSFSAKMNISDRILIVREHQNELLFAVQCFSEPYGVYVTVSCIAPSAPEVGELSCRISYTHDGDPITYEFQEVKRILEVSFETPQGKIMLIPDSYLRGESLDLKLFIKKKLNKRKKV